jgi:hypothetical protein
MTLGGSFSLSERRLLDFSLTASKPLSGPQSDRPKGHDRRLLTAASLLRPSRGGH